MDIHLLTRVGLMSSFCISPLVMHLKNLNRIGLHAFEEMSRERKCKLRN